ncbi:hypothetical protein AB6E39_18580 [Vibrio splendidus]|uniref:hypothetical protein n=1 Tax=Vibrio splendidus TaxID=29497 RepID=UPI001E39CD7C|nr:hypothetical protein [Vibrio splendidus]MCC4789892.1 hypothetical protein [Vibrio splendidus]
MKITKMINSLGFIFLLVGCQSTYTYPPQQKETLTNPPNEDTNIEKFLVFDKVSVRLFNRIPSLYKMKGEKVSYWSDKWLEVFLYENGSYYYDIAGYFEIEGKPRKIEITSNKKIYYEESLQKWNISSSDTEDIDITVKVNNKQKVLTSKVVELPFKKKATQGDLIEILGFPDRKKTYHVSWPCSKKLNGIWYSPAPSAVGKIDHWFYDEYPRLVIDVSFGEVREIHTMPYGERLTNRAPRGC